MWKYLTNVEKPAEKRKAEEDGDSQQHDSAKRVRNFQNVWLKKFKWLSYNEEKALMYCIFCSKYDHQGSSALVKGSNNFRIDSLNKHEVSKMHIKCENIAKASICAPGTSTAEKTLSKMNAAVLSKMNLLFRTAHAIAKHGRPFTDFVWHCNVDEKKGLDIGNTYRTDKKCREFISFIAEVERSKLEKDVKETKFMSLMCDESTDSSVTEELVLFTRYAVDGEINVKFVAIKQVERATADHIFHSLVTGIHEQCGLDEANLGKKLVGFASDGAAVMQGIHNGVQAKLKQSVQSEILTVHCLAHRLELALKSAFKDFALQKELDVFLQNVYVFYHRSPLNRSMLKRSCEALNIPQLVPTRTGGTRWIPHVKRALTHILELYPAIVQHLRQLNAPTNLGGQNNIAQSKAKGMLKLLQRRDLIEYAHFICDVIIILSKLSESFQQSQFTISDIQRNLSDALCEIKKLKHDPGFYFRNIIQMKGIFKGEPITGRELPEQNKNNIIDKICRCIEDRLFSCSDQAEQQIVNATKFFNFNSWPLNQQANFGDEAILKLTDRFQKVLKMSKIHLDEIGYEWTALKSLVYDTFQQVNEAQWKDINMKYRKCGNFNNILDLADLVLTLPSHSADCERAFSTMKTIKTDWRSSLSEDALTSLIRIQLHSPSETVFNPEEAVQRWYHTGNRKRRPFQPPYGKRIVSKQLNESENGKSDDSDDSDETDSEIN